ncbi:effector-associated constant component EACC1 [Micromonospora sp. WMMD729]|uniref:effector-associated constant component EACC1 n=1 Tax=Micromonospora sp. WMMD729 TaxID=3404127 RepID=UPI003BF5DBFB
MPASQETITLSVHPDLPSADARRSLASWLRSEDRLRGRVTSAPAPDATIPADEMSAGAADVLLVAVGSGGAAMVLVQSIAGWLTHRREDVTVRLTHPDGWSAELDVRRARDMGQVTALVEAAVRALAEHAPPIGSDDP